MEGLSLDLQSAWPLPRAHEECGPVTSPALFGEPDLGHHMQLSQARAGGGTPGQVALFGPQFGCLKWEQSRQSAGIR